MKLAFVEEEADVLNIRPNYSGKYVSTLAIDEKSKRPYWVHGRKAIWWKDNAWRVGLLENRGTDKSDIVSLTPTACPHSPDPNKCLQAQTQSLGSIKSSKAVRKMKKVGKKLN